MRFFLVFVISALSSFSAQAGSSTTSYPHPLQAQEYKLGVGDTVRIEVRDEPDLSLDAHIGTDGIIKYPFLGNLMAKGATITQLQREISNGLRAGYLVNPDVRVSVLSYRAFFITGQVLRAGAYPFVPGLTVEKAAALAGGFTDRASQSSIYVVREGQTQSQKTKVTLDALIYPGDTIVVEESLF